MKRLSCPIDVQLEVTEKCNFKCRHCYNYWRYDTEIKKKETDEIHFIKTVNILAENGISMITITGGEPLLRPNIVFSIIKEAKKHRIEVGLNTNASLVTSEAAKRLKEEGLDHVLCSILGNEFTHNKITGTNDGFSKTVKGIENLVCVDIPVSANMVVSKLNQEELLNVAEIVNNLGVKTFCATPMVPSHESNIHFALSGNECKQALKKLLQVKQLWGMNIDTLEPIARCLFDKEEDDDFLFFFGNRICSAAVTSCAISSTGMVRPCIHADKSFGNIFQKDFSSIWADMSPWSEEDMLPTECIDCLATAICEGGCRMSSKTTNGFYNGRDMYMSLPILDKKRVSKLPLRNTYQRKISPSEVVKINPLTKTRKESFGGIVYIGTNVEFLNHDGFQLFNVMVEKDSFSAIEIANEFGLDSNDVISVILTLMARGVILK